MYIQSLTDIIENKYILFYFNFFFLDKYYKNDPNNTHYQKRNNRNYNYLNYNNFYNDFDNDYDNDSDNDDYYEDYCYEDYYDDDYHDETGYPGEYFIDLPGVPDEDYEYW